MDRSFKRRTVRLPSPWAFRPLPVTPLEGTHEYTAQTLVGG